MDKDEECRELGDADRERIIDYCVRLLTPELLTLSAESANTVSMPVIHGRVSEFFASLKRARFSAALGQA